MAKPLVSKASNVLDNTINKHIRLLTALKEEADQLAADATSAKGKYRAGLKAAKADGLNTEMLVKAMNDKKREQEDVTADLKSYVRYLALVNMPVTQMDLFGTGAASAGGAAPPPGMTDQEHHEWEIIEAGKKAGREGDLATNCPHVFGSEDAQLWRRGWDQGTRETADRMATTGMKKASTRRTRIPKTGTAALN